MPTTSDSGERTLMLLGGSRHQVMAIEAAKRLGYRTVLCDYLPDNPGQYVADTFYLESTTDRDKMFEVALREHIDGIISFGSDAANPNAAWIAEQLGLPTNPYQSVLTLSEKYLVRPYLKEHGFACPGQIEFSADASPAEVVAAAEAAGLRYPLVLKPTDSSGSKGVTVIQSPDAVVIERALSAAREYSRNDMLVAEEFIAYDYPHLIGGDIFVANGEVTFWGLMDCLRDDAVTSLVPVGKAYPCGLDERRMHLVKTEVQRLVSSLDLSFGEMNVEVIMGKDDTPYILELGARAGGNMIPLQLTDISGIDLVEASVRFAMGDDSMDTRFAGNGSCIATSVLHSARTGTFRGVCYEPELKEHLYREMVFVKPGDHVERLVNGSQAFGVLFLRFDDRAQMHDMLGRMGELVHVDVD